MHQLLAWLDGIHHEAKHGHWPSYYEVGAGLTAFDRRRICVNCLKGGHRMPRRLWVLAGSRA